MSALFFFFFFTDTATTEIYTLSLHDALPIWAAEALPDRAGGRCPPGQVPRSCRRDWKSTRLNSSHITISYAVFCLKKKKTKKIQNPRHKEKKTSMNYVLREGRMARASQCDQT